MPTSYHHLSSEERAVIMLSRQENHSLRAIARKLCRPASTISREIRRADMAVYDATQAATGYAQRRQRCVRKPVLIPGTPLYQHVQTTWFTGAGRPNKSPRACVPCLLNIALDA